MARIIVNANVTLDGVVQDPSGDEGTPQGGWFSRMSDTDRAAWAEIETAESLTTDALLLGRRTEEWFGSRWLSRTGVWADRLNTMPKYVVSSTLQEPRWGSSTILRGDVVEEVRALKARVEGEVVVFGSRTLVHTLIDHDLVDELRLMVHPFVLGSGERLFGATEQQRPLRLIGTQPVGQDVVRLRYEVVH